MPAFDHKLKTISGYAPRCTWHFQDGSQCRAAATRVIEYNAQRHDSLEVRSYRHACCLPHMREILRAAGRLDLLKAKA